MISYVDAMRETEALGLRTGRTDAMYDADLDAIDAMAEWLPDGAVPLLRRLHILLRMLEVELSDRDRPDRSDTRWKTVELAEHLSYALHVAASLVGRAKLADPEAAAAKVRADSEAEERLSLELQSLELQSLEQRRSLEQAEHLS